MDYINFSYLLLNISMFVLKRNVFVFQYLNVDTIFCVFLYLKLETIFCVFMHLKLNTISSFAYLTIKYKIMFYLNKSFNWHIEKVGIHNCAA